MGKVGWALLQAGRTHQRKTKPSLKSFGAEQPIKRQSGFLVKGGMHMGASHDACVEHHLAKVLAWSVWGDSIKLTPAAY
jgi:hypothetical protein